MASSVISSQAGVDVSISSASKEKQRAARLETKINAQPSRRTSSLVKLNKPEAAQPLTSLRGLYFVRESEDKLKKAKLYSPKLDLPKNVKRNAYDTAVSGHRKPVSSFFEPSTGCKTCASRKYKDVSSDCGVSFQSATKLPSATAGISVMSHEGEHVSRETAKAQKQGSIITQKTVTAKMSVCPDCGRMYIAGGTTKITTKTPQSSGANVASMNNVLARAGEKIDEYI